MGYQFGDGFDNFGDNYSPVAGYPWDTVTGSTTRIRTTDYRFAPPVGIPGGCVDIPNSLMLRKNFGSFPGSLSNPSTIFVLTGIKFTPLPGQDFANYLTFWDSASVQVEFVVDANGAGQFWRGSAPAGGVRIGTKTANGTFQANVWYGLAVQVKIHSSTGIVQLFINGSPTATINSSGLNSQATGNAFATQVSIGNDNNFGTAARYDDFLCFDNSGTFMNALPVGSDSRIFTKLGSKAGNYTNWTPTGLATNWQNSSVQPPDVTKYNANNVGGTKDSYGTPLIGLTTNPFGVIVRASIERDDAGPHTPSLLIRSGGVD